MKAAFPFCLEERPGRAVGRIHCSSAPPPRAPLPPRQAVTRLSLDSEWLWARELPTRMGSQGLTGNERQRAEPRLGGIQNCK